MKISANAAAWLEEYHLEPWSNADLNFLAVSEIPADELARFSAAFREAAK